LGSIDDSREVPFLSKGGHTSTAAGRKRFMAGNAIQNSKPLRNGVGEFSSEWTLRSLMHPHGPNSYFNPLHRTAQH